MPWMRSLLLPLLLLPAAAPADDAPAAKDIFRRAVEAQGRLPDQVTDVTLAFEGEVHEKGETHTIERTYWFRSKDRSFRVLTGSAAADKTTDRGVLGADGYWERPSKGKILSLSRGNRDDAESIRQIEKERADFERMLRMVLLTRLDEGWTLAFGAAAPVRLDEDHPYEIRKTLGDRDKVTYYVLDARREGESRLRLFVNTDDYTVRKAIEYEAEDPDRVRWVYYFAGYGKDGNLGLVLPRYFSVYRDTPKDDATRDELKAAWGEPRVSLNTGLKDSDLRPATPE